MPPKGFKNLKSELSSKFSILITIDVEDWFQVENFKDYIPRHTWSDCALRVENNVHRLLDLLDTIELYPGNPQWTKKPNPNRETQNPSAGQTTHPRATFFVLGWVANKFPHLIKEISLRGHEVASHGFNHELCSKLSPHKLYEDLYSSKQLLEDLTGSQVYGYRAPSFSISSSVLGLVRDCDYIYDSSYNSFGLNKRYGQIDLKGIQRKGIAYRFQEDFFELPMSNLRLFNSDIPFSGGGYFRLFPLPILLMGIKRILYTKSAYLFYLHPWEIDSDQPRVTQASFLNRFRHYLYLHTTSKKLSKLLRSLSFCGFSTCIDYIRSLSFD